jgi:hypothetical protein
MRFKTDTVSMKCKGHVGEGDGGREVTMTVTVTKRVCTDSTKVCSYNTTRAFLGLSFKADLLPFFVFYYHSEISLWSTLLD